MSAFWLLRSQIFSQFWIARNRFNKHFRVGFLKIIRIFSAVKKCVKAVFEIRKYQKGGFFVPFWTLSPTFRKCTNFAKSENQWNESKRIGKKALKQPFFGTLSTMNAVKSFHWGRCCCTGVSAWFSCLNTTSRRITPPLLCSYRPAKPL